MRIRKPLVELIEDEAVRESLIWLYEYLVQLPILRGEFEFFEVDIRSSIVDESIPHKLGFVPKDIILTSATNGAQVIFNYDKFTLENIVVQTNVPSVIRFLAGRYTDESENLR